MTWSEAEKRARSETRWRVRALLAERFPKAFRGPGEPKPPLAVGIRAEILLALPDLSRRDLDIAMRDYVTGSTYLRSFVAGARRVDLEGSPVAEVTEAEISNAQLRLRAGLAAQDRAFERRQAAEAHRKLRAVKDEHAAEAVPERGDG